MKGVLFDMDGVLVDSEAFIAEAATAMFAERHQTVVQPGDFVPFVGTGEERYLRGVGELYGVIIDPEADKRRTYELYFELIRGRLREIPGAVAFVRDCRSRGLRLALATSADASKMVANLAEIGLSGADFDATVNGLEVSRKKPFPDIFLEAARRIGVSPIDCLVVEDAVTGVQAAKAAGCRCLGITSWFTAADLQSAGADQTAPHFLDLISFPS